LSELQYKNLNICHAEDLLNIWADADIVVDNVASEKNLQKFGFKQFSEEFIECGGIKLKVRNYKL